MTATGSPRAAVAELNPGDRLFDRYRIDRELGRGGYSVVYAAFDTTVNAEVAVKLLVPPPASAKEAKERLRREVQLVRGLRHPHIVGVHDFIEDGGLAFVVMDLIDGSDLAAVIARREAQEVDQIVRIGTQMADALLTAHRSGILHRDLKPANILLDRQGNAWLTDFGSARLDSQATMTRTGGLVGTVAYMAPEVWLGERPDARADIYALGVTLFEAATGRLPNRPSPHLPPTPDAAGFRPASLRPGLPPWLDQIIATATAADPRHRFATAEQLLDALTNRKFPARPMMDAALAAVEPVPPRKTIPVSAWTVLGGVGVSGAMAGITASPHLFWITAIVEAALWSRLRRVTVPTASTDAGPRRWVLDRETTRIVEALPPGSAKTLLEDVLVMARAQVERASTPEQASRWRTQLEPMVEAAVGAAIDLAEIDDTLGRLAAAGTRVARPPAGYWDRQADLERTRDGLSTALLELVGTLGKLRGIQSEDAASAQVRLTDLVGELKQDASRAVAAATELEAALSKSAPADRA